MDSSRRAAVFVLAILVPTWALSCDDESAEIAGGIEIVSGDGQSAEVGTSLPEPVVVRVTDADRVPLSGVGVSWKVTSGGGSVTAEIRSGHRGHASATWTLGSSVGQQSLRASVEGAGSVTITATGLSAGGR